MNKLYSIELADFNLWATDIMCTMLTKLSEQQWRQPLISSFPSIEQTTLHIAVVENIWVERLNQQEKVTNLQEEFEGTKATLLTHWKRTSEIFKEFVETFGEAKMLDRFSYRRLNGEENSLAFYQVFAHVVNHSSFHRGQLITLLRQVGFTDLQSTDLSAYYVAKHP